jgi:putative addiction module component (TIGR02574 family)
MNSRAMQVLRTELLDLPANERAQLAHDLVTSLDGLADSNLAGAWDAEILRRLDELQAGTARTIDREEFFRRMHERLKRV